ncbi:unnamed protein product [Orchesella dallaii]|uniref:Uncharacterized protein n=1 Tax=Orchesella dallaii TaxID=48710 RepID=A0ABP1PIA1_9HEXA
MLRDIWFQTILLRCYNCSFHVPAILNALNLRSYIKQGDMESLSLGCLVVFPSFLAACNMYFNYCNADTCVKFLNSLLDIEGNFLSTYRDDRSIHVARMLCKSFYLSTKIAPWLLAFRAGFTPCTPSNFVAPLNFMCGIIGTQFGLENDSGYGWWELLKSLEFVINFYLNKVLWGVLSRSCLVGLTHILAQAGGSENSGEWVVRTKTSGKNEKNVAFLSTH